MIAELAKATLYNLWHRELLVRIVARGVVEAEPVCNAVSLRIYSRYPVISTAGEI